jgi:beta-glucosidase
MIWRSLARLWWRWLLLCILLLLADASSQTATHDDDQIERKIDALLARITFEEKLGQMSQRVFPRREGLTNNLEDEIRNGRWSSFFNGGTLQQKMEAQRIAMNESRLGIPLIFWSRRDPRV